MLKTDLRIDIILAPDRAGAMPASGAAGSAPSADTDAPSLDDPTVDGSSGVDLALRELGATQMGDRALMYEGIVQDLIDELGRLPGVGPKGAQRIAFHILAADPADVARLAHALSEVKEKVRFCSICGNVTEEQTCRICRDPRRDQTILCVVEPRC